jgi:hypothetical protein
MLAPCAPPKASPMRNKRASMPEADSIVPNPCCGTLCAALLTGQRHAGELVKEAGPHRCSYDG